MMSVSLCNNNNRNTDYLYTNFAFLNVAILSSKPLLALRCRLDLVFSCTGFFLSEIIICSFNNNELRNVPMAKLFVSCTGQCPVFRVFLVAVTKFQDKFASLQQKTAKKQPKAGCVRAKIGLTRQLDRRQRGNYLKSYLSVCQK